MKWLLEYRDIATNEKRRRWFTGTVEDLDKRLCDLPTTFVRVTPSAERQGN